MATTDETGPDSAARPGMPKPSPDAVARFKEVVADLPNVSLRPMFGNLSAFANGYMFAGLFGDAVFLRLDEDDQTTVIGQGGTPFAPMPGRPMRGYVVLPDAWAHDVGSARPWAEQSLTHTMSLPPKAAKTSTKGRAAPRRDKR
jgi:TfoX/Sxy family transcriptional regulator of competence genes